MIDGIAPRMQRMPLPRASSGETAQLDVVLAFFGIILVFLSLLTFSIKIDQEIPYQTEYLAVEPSTRPMHTPSLAYVVPFYRLLLLDESGLFTLELAPIAEEIRNSTLGADDFGKTLRTSEGVDYGNVSLQRLDVSGFWMQLDAERLHETDLLQPLIPEKARAEERMDDDEFLGDAAQLAERMTPGFVMLNYAEDQGELAHRLVGLLLEKGWKIKAQPLRDGKISLQRHPDYFVLTDYFR
uniref:Uncharacterized protein n=1 Tax=Candidatus Kentrum sp. LPFa TaxID=2126335 RepID=A0A450W759_9GAMM|nr:MAG: hypothetical protein BECKLPF1236B_GA0070989_10416 [Candidatus Kentron sp. LPFa]